MDASRSAGLFVGMIARCQSGYYRGRLRCAPCAGFADRGGSVGQSIAMVGFAGFLVVLLVALYLRQGCAVKPAGSASRARGLVLDSKKLFGARTAKLAFRRLPHVHVRDVIER